MTKEEKAVYSAKKNEHKKALLQKESREEKIERLEKRRNHYKSKKITIADFLMEPYDLTYEPCCICKRILFTKQINIIKKVNIKATLPHDVINELQDKNLN